MIDKATVQRIKNTANIVEVVSDYVHLIRRGSNYMGLCPFHNERTPSFSVNPRRNICHCFSCGKGGSPVNFIMEKENISYYDALKQLAKKYGIKVEERELTPLERQVATEREGLLIAAEEAMKIMESDLKSTQEGKDIGLSYLYHRGVTEEAIKAFRLGYALDNSSYMTSKMQSQGFDIGTLKSLGLTGVGQSGRNYDKYRGRVIFPIMNSSGKTVGFGGRDLKGGPAKYINSPESVLYHKNNELYGIFQAKNEIVRQNNCFLVEGYLDVISMWQSGLKNVVASSGTSLTDGQIAIIHRFTSNITLVYDGDAPGIKAALRGIDMLLSHKMKVSVLLLPDGHDPDSFAKQNTPEQFREFVKNNSCDIIRFKMNVLMKEIGDDPRKKGEVVNSVVESIACIPEYVDRMIYVAECARSLDIEEKAVAVAVEKIRARKIEEMKLERRRKELDQKISKEDSDNSTNLNNSGAQNSTYSNHTLDSGSVESSNENLINKDSSELIEAVRRKEVLRQNPMKPVEKRMIELIIKYGYLNIPSSEVNESESTLDGDASGNPSANTDGADDYYPIIDFIVEELECDNVEFTVPEFKRVFEILIDAFDEFLLDFNKEKERISSEINQKRKEGHNKISSSAGSISEIERAEIKLEYELQTESNNRLSEFARFYPGNFLASHEDEDVRKVANEVIYEKYILSNLYSSPTDKDTTSFPEFQSVRRAITEWKSEILNNILQESMNQLRELSETISNSDFSSVEHKEGESPTPENLMARMQELQMKIKSIMEMRSQVAKNIGDRILCPRNIK